MKNVKSFKNLKELQNFVEYTQDRPIIIDNEDCCFTLQSGIFFDKNENIKSKNLIGYISFIPIFGTNCVKHIFIEVENENYENIVKKYKNKKFSYFLGGKEENIYFGLGFKF